MRHFCSHPNGQRDAIYEQVVCDALHHASCDTLEENRVPPTDEGQVKWYNRTIVTRLRHYVAEYQKECDKYVYPLAYAHSVEMHKSTNATTFSNVLFRHPPEQPLFPSRAR